jgi:hypothetical protein
VIDHRKLPWDRQALSMIGMPKELENQDSAQNMNGYGFTINGVPVKVI